MIFLSFIFEFDVLNSIYIKMIEYKSINNKFPYPNIELNIDAKKCDMNKYKKIFILTMSNLLEDFERELEEDEVEDIESNSLSLENIKINSNIFIIRFEYDIEKNIVTFMKNATVLQTTPTTKAVTNGVELDISIKSKKSIYIKFSSSKKYSFIDSKVYSSYKDVGYLFKKANIKLIPNSDGSGDTDMIFQDISKKGIIEILLKIT